MKINNDMIKKGLKNQLSTIISMIIFNVISYLIFRLSMVGIKEDESMPIVASLFPADGYKCNIFLVIASWVIFLIAFSIFYSKAFKKLFKKQLELHWSFAILFIIIGIIFVFIEISIYVCAKFLSLGLGRIITNYPSYMYIISIVYVFSYVIIDCVLGRRKK